MSRASEPVGGNFLVGRWAVGPASLLAVALRAAAALATLRRAGFTAAVTSHPLEARARAALGGSRFADVRWWSETGSTNADVRALARAGEPEGIVVVADHQNAGRGRRGRSWVAPEGSALLCTVLLRPRGAVAAMASMAVALAAAEGVASLTGAHPRLKWPNDLVWPGDGSRGDRKLGGILAEADWPAGSQTAGGWSPPGATERVVVAVGLGLNVAWGDQVLGGRVPGDWVPGELAASAVALDELTAPENPPDRADLLVAYLRRLDYHYGRLGCNEGAEAVRSAWSDRSATLGRRVRVDLGSDDLVGTAVALTPEGHLVVDTVEGTRRTVAVGDVVHLRPLDR
jgi:BirA family biotin operon repressor/biotin-[acetyl-CoA-carboxylase] ligase